MIEEMRRNYSLANVSTAILTSMHTRSDNYVDSWVEFEQARRTWWAVVILDR